MEKLKIIIDKYFLLIAFVVSVPAVGALFVKGFYGASDEMHPAWLYEMYETIKAGQIPPRFVPDLSFNHGYPLFNFVFPLPFYLASLVHFLGLNLVDSVKFVFLISIPLSAYMMYRLLRQFTDQYISLMGSLIYIYSPYRSTEIYVRGAIGEVLSFVFLPLIILSVFRLSEKKKIPCLKWIGTGALGIGGLILTHNIVSYMFFPFAAFYALIRLIEVKFDKKVLRDLVLFVILGLLAAIYFWLPAISESSLMQYSTVFNYWDHFPSLKQFVIPYFGYGASVPGPYDGISFFAGLPNLILIIVAGLAIVFKFRKMELKERGLILWSLLTVLLSVFLMNYRSDFLWKNIPLLVYFQFPWRFLALVTFTTSLLTVSIKYIPFKKVALIVLFFLLLLQLPYFRPQDFLGRTDDYYLKRYVPYPVMDPLYLTQNEEYLRLPKLTSLLMSRTGLFVSGDNGLEKISDLNLKRLGVEAKVVTNGDTRLSYGKYFFPGWTVYDNGKRIPVFATQPYGEVTFDLIGPGVHNIKVIFKETSLRLVLNFISLIAIVFCFTLIFSRKINTQLTDKKK